MPKQSPTAGLYFSDWAFTRFLVDLAGDGAAGWSNLAPSDLKYVENLKCWELPLRDGAVVFLHYGSPCEAVEKWNRRLRRLEGRRALVIASLRSGISEEMLTQPSALFPLFFLAPQEDGPPVDDLMYDRKFLQALSRYFEGVLAALPSNRQNSSRE